MMYKQTTVELNLNKTSDFNEYIENSMVSMIKDILKHFEKRYRKSPNDMYDDDDRYLYKQSEVDMFLKLNKNPNLKVEPQFDKGEITPWGWKIFRTNKKK